MQCSFRGGDSLGGYNLSPSRMVGPESALLYLLGVPYHSIGTLPFYRHSLVLAEGQQGESPAKHWQYTPDLSSLNKWAGKGRMESRPILKKWARDQERGNRIETLDRVKADSGRA